MFLQLVPPSSDLCINRPRDDELQVDGALELWQQKYSQPKNHGLSINPLDPLTIGEIRREYKKVNSEELHNFRDVSIIPLGLKLKGLWNKGYNINCGDIGIE